MKPVYFDLAREGKIRPSWFNLLVFLPLAHGSMAVSESAVAAARALWRPGATLVLALGGVAVDPPAHSSQPARTVRAHETTSTKVTMNWAPEQRKCALLRQILGTGQKAFWTFKDVPRTEGAGKKFTQADVWTNKETGILAVLLNNEHFAEYAHLPAFPSPYVSVLNTVKKWMKVQCCTLVDTHALHLHVHERQARMCG
mmetsp:Transcript_16124/g.48974  ORF Transcript_16124/g.48974 Transcript_16124/m.48974 type:complete len:199 (-) Transcript_16124:331-927(-)